VFTCSHLLLPSLDLFLPSKRVRFHHRLNDLCQLSSRGFHIFDIALIALHSCRGFVPVLFCLGGDGKLGNLLWWLIAADVLPLAFDIEYEGMLCLLVVKLRVIPFASTAAVEAVEADTQASWVVNAVEALCAVLTIDALSGCGCAELYAKVLGEVRVGIVERKSYRLFEYAYTTSWTGEDEMNLMVVYLKLIASGTETRESGMTPEVDI